MIKILTNLRIYDFEIYEEHSFVAFSDTIVKVAPMSEYDDYLAELRSLNEKYLVIDAKEKLLMPGLVLGHTHIYSSFARGWNTFFDPSSFQDILDQLWWKLDGALNLEDVRYSALASGISYLKSGITTVIDHHASGAINGSLSELKKALVDDIGMRGIFCFETSDRFNLDECIAENTSFYQATKDANRGDAASLFGFHASFSLSDESLRKSALLSKEMPIHIHVAESREDVEWTLEKCGKSIIERLDEFDLLRRGSLFAHGVHLEEKELEKIKASGGTLAFNVSSNMNNSVGLPPVKMAESLALPWIIGNDGLGFSLARDIQNLIFTANFEKRNSADFASIKQAITRSYEYAGSLLGAKLGKIEKGYAADFILLPYDSITPMTADNAFGHFIYGILENFHPTHVWCKGEEVLGTEAVEKEHKNYLEGALECAKRLWSRL